MRRSRRLDAHDLHRRRQRLLRARAVGLGVENQLRVVPGIDPRGVHAVEREIFLQNYNIVEAPRQKRRAQCAWCIIVGVAAAIEYTGTLRAGLLLRTAGQQPYLQQDYTERDCRH